MSGMDNLDCLGGRIRRLASAASIELVPPLDDKKIALLRSYAEDRDIHITAIGDKPYEGVFSCVEALIDAGLRPVPHLPARRFENAAEVRKALTRFARIGCNRLLLVAGDDAHPAGSLTSTLPLLQQGFFQEFGIRHISFAGHPEMNWNVRNKQTDEDALSRKVLFIQESGMECTFIMQACLNPEAVVSWACSLKQRLPEAHVAANLFGPTPLGSLNRYGMRYGFIKSADELGQCGRELFRIPEGKNVTIDRYLELVSGHPSVDEWHFSAFGPLFETLTYIDALGKGILTSSGINRSAWASLTQQAVPA